MRSPRNGEGRNLAAQKCHEVRDKKRRLVAAEVLVGGDGEIVITIREKVLRK